MPSQPAAPRKKSPRAPRRKTRQRAVSSAAPPAAADPAIPIRIPSEHHLGTGLADYSMWVRMFADNPPSAADPGTYRRGRIWV
jgi:cyanobactin cluster PatC/TenC/TruC protein